MKNLLIIFLISIQSCLLFAQEATERHFADELIVGSSFTYILFKSNDDDIKYNYHELTTNINLSTHVGKNVYVGLNYLDIRGINNSNLIKEKERNNYFMTGAFAQYDFLGKSKSRLMAEVSYQYGNYCTCGKSEPYQPYKSENLSYIGFGGAYDWHLVKGLFLDIGFNVYTILNKREKKDIFTQYILGVNYHFSL